MFCNLPTPLPLIAKLRIRNVCHSVALFSVLSGLSESMVSPSGAGGGAFNYHGDTLSPEHPRNFAATPVIENNREMFYCNLCSFCGGFSFQDIVFCLNRLIPS